MHNEFYASGFIYHPASQQILLHQHPEPTNESAVWHLFGGVNRKDETPLQTFHRVVSEQLGLPILISQCFSVYDYKHKEKNTPIFIHYAILETLPEEEIATEEAATGWFAFKQIAKLSVKQQTKQDIIVGQRVINLALRQLEVPA